MNRRRFSLLEVVVALAILAAALGAGFAIVSQSQQELLRARDRWTAQHAAENVTEYALLAPPKSLSVPADLLPPGYSARVAVAEALAEQPEPAQQPQQGWVPARYQIEVQGPAGQPPVTQTVLKLLPEGEL